MLGGLTEPHISETVHKDFVNQSMFFYGQHQSRQFLVFGGGLTNKNKFFFMRGVIVPPS